MKMAIVTGAARGIGFATARLFVDQGYQVAMVDRDGDALDAAAASLAGSTAFVCDVSARATESERAEGGRVGAGTRTKLLSVSSSALAGAEGPWTEREALTAAITALIRLDCVPSDLMSRERLSKALRSPR